MDLGKGHKENRRPRVLYRHIFTRTKVGYKNIGREAGSHNRTGARLASGIGLLRITMSSGIYGEWLSPLVGDSIHNR